MIHRSVTLINIMKSIDMAADVFPTRSRGVISIPENEPEECTTVIRPHPLGIKPAGNLYMAIENARPACGNFQQLPDEILMTLLESFESEVLIRLSSTCRFLHAFCRSDDLWKALFIQSNHPVPFKWRGSWRATLLKLAPSKAPQVMCQNVYSDVLYRPFLCTHTPLTSFVSNIPTKNLISRLDDLTQEEFSAEWSDKPFILTSPVREWPVSKQWDIAELLKRYGEVKFRAEAVDWPLKTYVQYMQASSDESPLYLFDRSFVEKMDLKVGRSDEAASYWIPDCFGEDLFAVLGDDRPDSRWLIVGPERSGSTFHKDPNATSAWNAVLRGSKYWIMFPATANTPPPPGVYVSEDQSEVTSPLSIAEWFLGFHAEARKTSGCVEGICGEGEVLHVPSGWWHLVVNLDTSIAITQNFVPRSHLSAVLSFLRDKPDQVSGFKKEVENPHETFVKCMQRDYPVLLEQGLAELKKSEGKKRKWDELVHSDEGNSSGGFSFGFVGDGDSDEEIS